MSDVNGDHREEIFVVDAGGLHGQSVIALDAGTDGFFPLPGVAQGHFFIDSSRISIAGFFCATDQREPILVVWDAGLNEDKAPALYEGTETIWRPDAHRLLRRIREKPLTYKVRESAGITWPPSFLLKRAGACGVPELGLDR